MLTKKAAFVRISEDAPQRTYLKRDENQARARQRLARLANRQDQMRGALFEGRFKTVAILDDEALLTVCADIDLNPIAAGIAELPETSEHTSNKHRVHHMPALGRTEDLATTRCGSLAGSAAAGMEESLWLCPIEDRRGVDSSREGMIEGFSLGNYLLLVDYTGGLFREEGDDLTRGRRDPAADRQQRG